MEQSGDSVHRSSGYGAPQSSRPCTLRAPLLDSHRTWETVVEDLLLRLCLWPWVWRLAGVVGLCEQWRRLRRWRTLVRQHVCPPGLDAGSISNHESFIDGLLAILWAGISGAGSTYNQEDKNSFRTRSTVELPDYILVLQFLQNVTGERMGLSLCLFDTG